MPRTPLWSRAHAGHESHGAANLARRGHPRRDMSGDIILWKERAVQRCGAWENLPPRFFGYSITVVPRVEDQRIRCASFLPNSGNREVETMSPARVKYVL